LTSRCARANVGEASTAASSRRSASVIPAVLVPPWLASPICADYTTFLWEGGQSCPQPPFSRLWPGLKRQLRPRLAALQAFSSLLVARRYLPFSPVLSHGSPILKSGGQRDINFVTRRTLLKTNNIYTNYAFAETSVTRLNSFASGVQPTPAGGQSN